MRSAPRRSQGAYDAYTHIHPFSGPLSRTTWVSRHQKGKPVWILLKRETVSSKASAGPYASLHCASDKLPRQHPGCPSCHPTNCVKALKAQGAYDRDDKITPRPGSNPCVLRRDWMRLSIASRRFSFSSYSSRISCHQNTQHGLRLELLHFSVRLKMGRRHRICHQSSLNMCARLQWQKQVCVQLPTSADNVTLLTVAADGRPCSNQ